jgi:hypothetical protein
LLWVLPLAVVPIILSMMFGGFQKGPPHPVRSRPGAWSRRPRTGAM